MPLSNMSRSNNPKFQVNHATKLRQSRIIVVHYFGTIGTREALRKTRESAQLLTSLFRLRKVHKTYLAICHGELDKDSGEWNDDLIRYDGEKKIIEKAKTLYKVIDKNSEAFEAVEMGIAAAGKSIACSNTSGT